MNFHDMNTTTKIRNSILPAPQKNLMPLSSHYHPHFNYHRVSFPNFQLYVNGITQCALFPPGFFCLTLYLRDSPYPCIQFKSIHSLAEWKDIYRYTTIYPFFCWWYLGFGLLKVMLLLIFMTMSFDAHMYKFLLRIYP